MDVETIVREYITQPKTRMMQIATSVRNSPWICTVFYAVDDGLNIYWISIPSRRHSEEIAKNPNVAVAFAYDQQPPQPYVRGVQAEGKARLLEGDEAAKAANLYAEQLNSDPNWIADVISGKDPHRVYVMKPTNFVLFDSKNFPKQSRREWRIDKK